MFKLRDLGLDKYIAKDASVPGVAKEGQPTAQRKWRELRGTQAGMVITSVARVTIIIP